MNIRSVILFLAVSSAVVLSASCSKDKKDKPTPKEPLKIVVVKDLPADPITRDIHDGHIIGNPTNQYTLFRFSDSTIVPHEDSATTKWDIGFHSTDIILNSGANGPGNVEGQVVMNTLEGVAEAPHSGYKTGAEAHKLLSDFTNGWFNYDPQNHIISAKPGYILIIHTNDGKYVKMEILSFYKGMPAHPTIQSEFPYYNFRYVVQQDGSRKF